jgi:hypothetical protein
VTTRCPLCFVNLAGAPLAFRCTSPQCAERADPVASRFLGATVTTRPVTVVRSGSARCQACGGSALVSACPHCHAPLPQGWLNWATTCIAMAGARASGKSIYLAVLKRQAEQLAQLTGESLTAFNPETDRTYRQVYEAPLYEQRGLIAATPRHDTPGATQRVPLIFHMGSVGGRPHMLVIRDVAGENLEDPHADASVFGFFRHADGVFFLFDPMRVEQIRQQLAGVVPDQRALGGDPYDVLTNLARLMRGESNAIRTPLAVVVAKFDTLAELRNVAGAPLAAALRHAGAAYSRDPSLNAPDYDHEDGELLSAEVSSLLTRLDARPLLSLVGREFGDSRMFAVSALGAAPTGQTLHPRGIAPFRCLDPLKWVLSRTARVA